MGNLLGESNWDIVADLVFKNSRLLGFQIHDFIQLHVLIILFYKLLVDYEFSTALVISSKHKFRIFLFQMLRWYLTFGVVSLL